MNNNHTLTISYELIVPEGTIEFLKENNGTRYWVEEEEAEISTSEDGDTEVTFGGVTYTFNTTVALRGLALWAQSHSQEELTEVIEEGADHMTNDEIWQLGFFGELVYG